MVVPDPGIQAQLELTVTLPADWPLEGLLRTDGEESSEDENWYWPIRLLKFLARFPHKFETWLGSGHTTTNGDPPVPFAPDTKLCGALVAPSILSPKEFGLLELDDVTIEFLSVIPLYREEIDLKKRFGADVLLKKLEKNQITELIDPQRKNVAKKRFGLF
jgi:hypothetical protein